VIPRLTSEDGAFGASLVRQLELMGSAALNSGDALERLLNPLATRQALAQKGIAAPSFTVGWTDLDRPLKHAESKSPALRLLVIGDAVVAALERRHGKAFDVSKRKLRTERTLAKQAAAALGLGLAGIDIADDESGPAIVRVSATPSLDTFETRTGIRVAEQVIAHLEQQARSWVLRQAETAGR
jgi:glutathione synthase/RimK-type ligase-like ATP-grasp enzyme